MLKTVRSQLHPILRVSDSDSHQQERAFLILKISFVILGLYAIFSRLWAAEDAYISFRYIDNLLQGNGLVYNIGDRVEGFTHPLWLALVTIPAALGLPIRMSALLLSLVLTSVALIWLTFREKNSDGVRASIPIALVLLLSHTGFRDFSVSGLEFPLVCFLMIWFYQSYREHDLLGKPTLHGMLLVLLYLTRPELALLIISFYAILAWKMSRQNLAKSPARERIEWRDVWSFSLPILSLAGGYHLFRWSYYGAFFPNTFYAKDGLGSYWSEGIKYLLHFWQNSPVLLAATIGWIVLLAAKRQFRAELFGNEARKIMLAQAALLAIYVVKIGGDFMAFRFLLPSMLILVSLMSESFGRLIMSLRFRRAIGASLLAATTVFVLWPYTAPRLEGYIADERQIYDVYHPAYRALFEEPTEHIWYKQGLELRALQEKTGYPLSISSGNIGYLGFAAGPRVTIVDIFGLVDNKTTHDWMPVTKRGRPGHELKLTLPMTIDRRVSFAYTRFKDWNSIMGTDAGTIMTLDPKFLRYFPERVKALKDYKKMIQEGTRPRTPSFDLLELLESQYGVKIENL